MADTLLSGLARGKVQSFKVKTAFELAIGGLISSAIGMLFVASYFYFVTYSSPAVAACAVAAELASLAVIGGVAYKIWLLKSR